MSNISKEDFCYWLDTLANEVKIVEGEKGKTKENKTDSLRKYYVYALCEKRVDGTMIPFYIGKGTRDRVWSHEDGEEKEKQLIEEKYGNDGEEFEKRKNELSAKYKRIGSIQETEGKTVEKIIVKCGLTEYESFMCESTLINMFRMTGLKFVANENDKLSNIVNGHANIFEKMVPMETKARAIDEFADICKKPLVLNDLIDEYKIIQGKKILLQNINASYPKCKNKQNIREAVSGNWVLDDDCKEMEYVFAVYESRIVGVYKVKTVHGNVVHNIYDFDEEIFPQSEELDFRKTDYHYAKSIYEDLRKKNLLRGELGKVELDNEISAHAYTHLSDEVKKLVQQDANKDEKGHKIEETIFFNKVLSRSIKHIEKDKIKKSFGELDESVAICLIESMRFNPIEKSVVYRKILSNYVHLLNANPDGDGLVENLYSKLSIDLQNEYKEWYYNNRLKNWFKRKYIVLEDIPYEYNEAGDDISLNSLVGCEMYKKENGKIVKLKNHKDFKSNYKPLSRVIEC